MNSSAPRSKGRPEALAEKVYQALKHDIFDFRLMPGDRFSENEIAERLSVSRTPVRQALFWLEREGYVEVWFRSGWQVRPFDFAYFEALYDFRIVLEREAVRRLCAHAAAGICAETLAALVTFWIDDARLEQMAKRYRCRMKRFTWRWWRRQAIRRWRASTRS